MIDNALVDECVAAVEVKRHELTIFMSGISQWFSSHPVLSRAHGPAVHSVKSRFKDSDHLRDKIVRKWNEESPIAPSNVFQRVTDLVGVRVLHLYQEQFVEIHDEILRKVNTSGDWHLVEPPRAYTWDPESTEFFDRMGVVVQVKPSFYTSVHYVVRPRPDSPLCCEIQVRTLFEEIWGEVDHRLNYPNPTENLHCREQLRVLAKLVGTGSRLVDSVFRSASH